MAKGYPLSFRCYAERQGGQFIAVCIDLGLAAQGDAMKEAREKLHSQVASYIYDAIVGEDREHANDLLTRRAPLNQILRYHVLKIAGKIRKVKLTFREFLDATNLQTKPRLQRC